MVGLDDLARRRPGPGGARGPAAAASRASSRWRASAPSLHVSGTDKAALEATVERFEAEGTHRWSLQVAGLEEAFIYLMAGARDNFAATPGEEAA